MKACYRYIIWFALYSILGWCYEVTLEVFIYHWGYSDRGVLFGPYCPVYGFGAMLFLVLVYPLIKGRPLKERLFRLPLVFLMCMTTATLLELATSYLLEFLTGSWPWLTYVNYTYHFQGRIALSPSLRFGLGGIIFLYLLQPLFEGFCDRIGEQWVKRLALTILAVLAGDLIITVLTSIL